MDFNQILQNFNCLSLDEQELLKKNLKTQINWKQIIPNLKLSENVLEAFADELNWNDVVKYQYHISSDFYLRHKFRL
jgi:hypothetical protein